MSLMAREMDGRAIGIAQRATEELPSTDREAFVEAMSGAVTGVNVVTTDGPAGMFGITVSAVASVSAEPPMILACVNRRSPACEAIRRNGVFCVNLLESGQSAVSDTFAGRPANGAPFDFGCADWQTAPSGSPRLPGAVASFDCVLDVAQEAGSHTIFIGRVVSAASAEGDALAYCRRAYCTPARFGSDG